MSASPFRTFVKFLTGGQILDRLQQNIATALDSLTGNVNLQNIASLQSYGLAFPTGAAAVGQVVWNTAPTSGGFVGWVCVKAGTPGTWKTFGAIS